ncbi:hypothetical protein [Wolbachia endosymbiont (group A) of Clivina fossor]|uniref:hypothetical protein n=1 Tax=Wolbachia endosymbiont (group A) of Clivina fossor TaxID=3066133 RepID=UPI0031332312
MPANLTFKDGADALIPNANIKKIVYEDDGGNKYTFGVDNATNVFNTFKYKPNGATEIDYSATATKFMTGGTIATLLGIGNNVDAIKTKTDFIPNTLTDDVADIKDDVANIKNTTSPANLGNKVTAIKTKTDFIPNTLTDDVIPNFVIGKTNRIYDKFT